MRKLTMSSLPTGCSLDIFLLLCIQEYFLGPTAIFFECTDFNYNDLIIICTNDRIIVYYIILSNRQFRIASCVKGSLAQPADQFASTRTKYLEVYPYLICPTIILYSDIARLIDQNRFTKKILLVFDISHKG